MPTASVQFWKGVWCTPVEPIHSEFIRCVSACVYTRGYCVMGHALTLAILIQDDISLTCRPIISSNTNMASWLYAETAVHVHDHVRFLYHVMYVRNQFGSVSCYCRLHMNAIGIGLEISQQLRTVWISGTEIYLDSSFVCKSLQLKIRCSLFRQNLIEANHRQYQDAGWDMWSEAYLFADLHAMLLFQLCTEDSSLPFHMYGAGLWTTCVLTKVLLCALIGSWILETVCTCARFTTLMWDSEGILCVPIHLDSILEDHKHNLNEIRKINFGKTSQFCECHKNASLVSAMKQRFWRQQVCRTVWIRQRTIVRNLCRCDDAIGIASFALQYFNRISAISNLILMSSLELFYFLVVHFETAWVNVVGSFFLVWGY